MSVLPGGHTRLPGIPALPGGDGWRHQGPPDPPSIVAAGIVWQPRLVGRYLQAVHLARGIAVPLPPVPLSIPVLEMQVSSLVG
jgi:hypothetical protein